MNNEEQKEAIIRAAEDQRIQEAQWIEEELERQRKIEDDVRVQLQEEQRLLDEKKKSINENMERTLQLRRYNDEKKAAIESQAYGLYGITGDKLEGLDRYKNAMFKGTAAGFFILTLAFAVLSGFLNGFDNQITLYMFGLMAAEGALLPRGNNKGIYRFICSVMYFTLLPAAAFIFITYELGFTEFDFVRKYIVMAALLFAAFGVLGYFAFNPYSKDRRNIRLARKDLKVIKIDAAKNVKKNERERVRQEGIDARAAAKQQKEQAEALEAERKAREAAEAKAKKEAEAAEAKAKKEAEAAEAKAKKEAAAAEAKAKREAKAAEAKAKKAAKADKKTEIAKEEDAPKAIESKEDAEKPEETKEIMGPHAI